jgi:hypothetical protein
MTFFNQIHKSHNYLKGEIEQSNNLTIQQSKKRLFLHYGRKSKTPQ